MHTPTSLRWLLPIIVFAAPALALDWWIDQSCETKLGDGMVENMLKQAVQTAKAVREKLDAGDTNMLNVFSQLMSFDYDGESNAAEKDFFHGILGDTSPNPFSGVTAFRPSTQSGDTARTSSYLRVYCDESQHWKLRLDDDKLDPPNSERPAEEKIYKDEANMMIWKGTRCGESPDRMLTSSSGGMLEIAPGTQSAKRYTIDICDSWINEPNRKELVPELPVRERLEFLEDNGDSDTDMDSDSDGEADLAGIDNFDSVGSMIMLHELTHAMWPKTRDAARRWFDVCRLDAATSVRTADSYKMLGSAEQMLRQKYKLDPEELAIGDLVYDDGLSAAPAIAARSMARDIETSMHAVMSTAKGRARRRGS